ncbi:MAG TPA: SAF domain-containing protein [Ilumatobacteraceae bacterium]|nr:SAF domain-containing protein [Ilumatobacteraceae bacterium]
MTDARVSAPVDQAGRGFQPVARRRNRIALGVLLAAIAIGGNVWLYSTLNLAEPVLQVVRDVPAGEQLTSDMLRTVEVDADSTVNLVPGDQLDSLVGSYAKVRLVSGSLVTAEALQSTPLVSTGSSVVAIQVGEGTLPIGVRERAAIMLVIPSEAGPTSIDARVVGLPVATSSALGFESLSVEVDAGDAATVAAADDVRVVLVEPSDDPAAQQDGGP